MQRQAEAGNAYVYTAGFLVLHGDGAQAITWEGMVFFTHAENPANDITSDQAQTIYAEGSIREWPKLDGKGALVPYCGEKNTNDVQFQLERLILKGAPVADSVKPISGITDLYNSVANFTASGYGLGFGYYTVPSASIPAAALKVLSFDGIIPGRQNIADRS